MATNYLSASFLSPGYQDLLDAASMAEHEKVHVNEHETLQQLQRHALNGKRDEFFELLETFILMLAPFPKLFLLMLATAAWVVILCNLFSWFSWFSRFSSVGSVQLCSFQLVQFNSIFKSAA